MKRDRLLGITIQLLNHNRTTAQRLALARLWFQDAEIIILDEATSAMDNLTEEGVMSEVMNILQDKTVIFIAHRLNSIRSFKRIIAFKGGNIVAEGNFDELMDKSDYFKMLYSLGEQLFLFKYVNGKK